MIVTMDGTDFTHMAWCVEAYLKQKCREEKTLFHATEGHPPVLVQKVRRGLMVHQLRESP